VAVPSVFVPISVVITLSIAGLYKVEVSNIPCTFTLSGSPIVGEIEVVDPPKSIDELVDLLL
jgi:hypothetical protein